MSAAAGGLEGRVALVTGGGRGLGRGIALALAGAGAEVAIASRSPTAAEQTAGELRALGRRALVLQADVLERGVGERIVEATIAGLGRLDIVVNNSGVTHVAPALETSEEDWEHVIATNLTGTFTVARAAGRHLTVQGAGKVINVASMFGLHGAAHFSAYCASKAAVLSLTRVLALEWAPYGVQVNALAPGYIETDMNASLRSDDEAYTRMLRRIPAGRMARVDEVAAAALYLASPAADYVTGAVLSIDGGYGAR